MGEEHWVWVRRLDVTPAAYDLVRDVDPQQLVADFVSGWLARRKPGADASLVTLRLVSCGAHKPSAAQEQAALHSPEALLDDPSLTLREAHVAHNTWLLAHFAVDASAPAAAELVAHVGTRLERVEQTQQQQQQLLSRMLPLSVQLFLRTFRYSDSNLGSTRSTCFKAQLLEADGQDVGSAHARCYVLNVELPRHLVIGAHLFKREWSYLAKEVLDIDDVDDIRNGLLLYKPLHWAFDSGRIAFVLVGGAFVVRLLDFNIRGLSLHAKAAQLLCKLPEQQAQQLAKLERDWPLPEALSTFGALHDARLALPAGFCPWRRCLCFHALVSRQQAVRNGWLTTEADAPFDDFWSEGSDSAERVQHWLDHTVTVAPLRPVSEHSGAHAASDASA
jgi:hypothetical protein